MRVRQATMYIDLKRLLFSVNLAGIIAAANAVTVDLGYASYYGTYNETIGISSFLGIRYAAPPVGDLRFQAPAPPPEYNYGLQSATVLPAECPQGSQGKSATSPDWLVSGLQKRATPLQSEDCLFVNVYVEGSNLTEGSNLPVLVWIHGGGYVAGTAASYGGADLVQDGAGGVVVVDVQYRLGAFGFLAGEEVNKRGVLNAGLLDQEYALKWIQKYIHFFGGDKDKVTIWGESAGAGSVIQQMVAHGGNTQPALFRAGLTSSTFLPFQFQYNDEVPELLYQQIVEQTGCANATDTFLCLVDIDWTVLQTANAEVCSEYFFGVFAFVPVVDGSFIQERPIKAILEGKLNGEALFAVTNSYEGRIFVNDSYTSNLTLTQYVEELFPQFNETLVNATVSIYEGLSDGNVTDSAITIMGESIFICPTYALLEGFNGSSWKGELAVPPANHGSDLGYYFPSNRAPPVINATLSASFAGSFLGVAEQLSPNDNPLNASITPQWDTWSSNHTEVIFNATDAGEAIVVTGTTDDALLQRCKFWQSIAPAIPQ